MLYGKCSETINKVFPKVYFLCHLYFLYKSWVRVICSTAYIYCIFVTFWCYNAVLKLHICVNFCILLGRLLLLYLGAYTLIFAVIAKQRKTMPASCNQTQIRKAQLYLLSLSELQLVSILQHHLLLTAPGNLLCYSTLLCTHSGFLRPFLLG